MTNEPTTPASGGAQEPADARVRPFLFKAHAGAMDEASISILARAIRESLRSYGHRVAESSLPECIAADVSKAFRDDAIMTALKRSPAESGDGFRDGLEKAVEVAIHISDREAGLANDMPAGGDWQKHQHASNVALDIACLIRVETLAAPPPAESGGAQTTAVGEECPTKDAGNQRKPSVGDNQPMTDGYPNGETCPEDGLIYPAGLSGRQGLIPDGQSAASRDQVRREGVAFDLPEGMVPYGPNHADYPNQPKDWDESGNVYVLWGDREFEIMADEPRYLTWKHSNKPGQDQGNIVGYSVAASPHGGGR